MAYQTDYLLRMIEEMGEVLRKTFHVNGEDDVPLFDEQGNLLESGLFFTQLRQMLDQGRVNEAENLLFERLEAADTADYLNVAVQFYRVLGQWSDEKLQTYGFSRQEVAEGLEDVRALLRCRQEDGAAG